MQPLDMDKMIKECMDIMTENEVMVFGFGVGRVAPTLNPFTNRKMKEAMEYIKTLDGFIGIHPISLYKNVLIFDSLNNSKTARNMLKHKNCPCGHIVPLRVNKYWTEVSNGSNSTS